jgi:sugar lactone lactonase YvrE
MRNKPIPIGIIFFLMLFITACGSSGWGPTPSPKHSVSGTVSGLSGSGLVLQNNGGDDLSISADGTFTFATPINNGSSYAITVKTEPTGTDLYQTCAVDNGSGTVNGANVTDVSVTCSTSAWETLVSLAGNPSFSDFTPTGKSVLYNGEGTSMQNFTFPTTGNPQGIFTTLNNPIDIIGDYVGFAWVGDNLYMVQGKSIYAYSITGNSWTKPVNGTLNYNYVNSQSTADDSGFVYSLSNSGTHQLLKYDTINNTVVYYLAPDDIVITFGNEPRVAWDSKTQRVYLADYENSIFYAFNPADGTFTALAPLPNSSGMSDAFCSDRRGHIFTGNGNGSSRELLMYTAETNTWTSFPKDIPFNQGGSNACSIAADGWLYFGDGNAHNFARIKVF